MQIKPLVFIMNMQSIFNALTLARITAREYPENGSCLGFISNPCDVDRQPMLQFWASMIAGPETRFVAHIVCRHFGFLRMVSYVIDYLGDHNVICYRRANLPPLGGPFYFDTDEGIIAFQSLVIPTISFSMAVAIRDVFMFQGAPVNLMRMNAFLQSVMQIMDTDYNCNVLGRLIGASVIITPVPR